MTRVAPLLALLCTGCFSAHPLEEGESGARLELIAWAPEDGSGVHVEGLFDRELAVRCGYRSMADGNLRCLPSPSRRLMFTDDWCARPAAAIAAGCDPTYVTAGRLTPVDTGCGGTIWRFSGAGYRVRDRVDAERLFELDDTGACVEATSRPEGELRALERMADEQFVSAELVVGERSGVERLGATYLVGDDGSRFWNSFYDHGREDFCVPFGARSGPIPCLVGRWGIARDPSGDCGGPLVERVEASCALFPPTEEFVSARFDETGCAVEEVTVYGAGEEIPAESLTCSVREDATFHRPVELPEGRVATLSNRPEGTGRLRRIRGRTAWMASYPPFHLGTFEDASLGGDCAPRDVNGVMRCVPARAHQVAPVYADAGCSEPASVESSSECSEYRWWFESEPGCLGGASQFFRVGPETEAGFERDEDGACVPVELRMGERVHRLEAVPDETFAAFRRI